MEPACTSRECSDKDIEDMMGACRLHDAGAQIEELDYIFTQKSQQPFDIDYFQPHDDRVRFYTGLHSFDILEAACNFVAPRVTRKSSTPDKFQEFGMVLMKLRLNMPYQDLAYRFDISVSIVSRILFSWLLVMDVILSPLISWPSREDLWRTMPQCFKYSSGKRTTVIIDCFEIFIDRPSDLLARAQTHSNYKHHNYKSHF